LQSQNSLESCSSSSSLPKAISPSSEGFLEIPVKPAARGSYETARQRKIWYGLVAAGHGAAVFDAYTTRRAISRGYGTESNPLLRPFANSNAMYFATQVSPAVMDYLGHRMMTSEHGWMRRIWWVPQVAGTACPLARGSTITGWSPECQESAFLTESCCEEFISQPQEERSFLAWERANVRRLSAESSRRLAHRVRFSDQAHRARAFLGLDIFQHGIFIRTLLFDDRGGSFPFDAKASLVPGSNAAASSHLRSVG
jgi:hypothetical protein